MFNYLTNNKDDHCKNFSLYVVKNSNIGAWHWRLAQVYDLTLCTEEYNGEHVTSVNCTDRPGLSYFISVGTKIKLPEARCREIIDEIRSGYAEIIIRYTFK